MATNIPENQTFVGVVIDHISAHHYVVQYFGGYLEARIWPGAITQPKIGDNVIVKPFPNAGYNLIISGPSVLSKFIILLTDSTTGIECVFSEFDPDIESWLSPNLRYIDAADMTDWNVTWNNARSPETHVFWDASGPVLGIGATSYVIRSLEDSSGYNLSTGDLWASEDLFASTPRQIGPTTSWPRGSDQGNTNNYYNSAYGISSMTIAPDLSLWFTRSYSGSNVDGDDVNYPLQVYRCSDGINAELMYTAKGFSVDTTTAALGPIFPSCSADPSGCDSATIEQGSRVASDARTMTISPDGRKIVIFCATSCGFGMGNIGSVGIIRSLDGGSTWEELTNWQASPVPGGYLAHGNGQMPWSGSGGGAFADSLAAIYFVNDRLIYHYSGLSPGYFYSNGRPGISISEDYGETWFSPTLPGGVDNNSYFLPNGYNPTVSGGSTFYYWSFPYIQPFSQGIWQPDWGNVSFVYGSRASGPFYESYDADILLRTIDGGLTWDEIIMPLEGVNDMMYDPENDRWMAIYHVGSGPPIMKKIDNFSKGGTDLVDPWGDTSAIENAFASAELSGFGGGYFHIWARTRF